MFQWLKRAPRWAVSVATWLVSPAQALALLVAVASAVTAAFLRARAWAWPFILALTFGAAFWAIHGYFKVQEFVRSRRPRPIEVDRHIWVDFDHIKAKEDGENIEDAISVALCLRVTNGQQNGAVLRKLQARSYSLVGEQVVLPIRGSENGLVDLRHGEMAIVEVGRVLWRIPVGQTSYILPGMFRPGAFQTYEREEVRCNSFPKDGSSHRIIKLADASGESKSMLGEAKDIEPGFVIKIVLSADDVKSRTLHLRTNLYAEDARDWLKLVPDVEMS